MVEQAQNALREYFGYEEFRPEQGKLIEQVIAGRDVVGVMPTGAGKSLVYQIPAIVSEGIAIVISPLISLMKDQVNALNLAGVRTAFLNSSISVREQAEVLEYAESGSCKLLYVAPERLDMPQFLAFSKRAKISLVAVDEAHCVSQWGQDFRPSYLGIADYIDSLPMRPPVCALTATATPEVQVDIATALRLDDPFALVSGFDRPNLYFGVERPEPKEKRACLLRLAKEHAGQSGIVYCSTRATVEEVCALLCDNGYPATRYHAGLSANERHTNQDDFLYDRKPIMVATNAFGMGIDKSNVSFVIHYALPSDVESYYQEAGRAGRDGSPADCILIYNKKDVQTCQFLIDKSFEERAHDPQSRAIHERDCERLRQMVFYATTVDCLRAFILRYFGQTDNPFRCEHCSNCSTEFDVEDATLEARKIISCVLRVEQLRRHVGKGMISDILRGSKAEKLISQHLDELSTYGIMSDVPAKRIRYILDALVAEGLLAQTDGSYPVVVSTEEGIAFVKGDRSFEIKMPKRMPKKEKLPSAKERIYGARAEEAGSVDRALFEQLKELRSKLAAEQGVPAYIVFTNAALTDMCAKMPSDETELLDVSGVGRVKAERYGKAFLEVIAQYRATKA